MADPSLPIGEGAWLADFEIGTTLEAHTQTVTYRARRKHDDRAVVLRVMKKTRRETSLIRRALERELTVLRAVDHPAVPALLDVVKGDGQVALVIEDHGGHRLDEILTRAKKLEPLVAVAIAIEVADALAAVHRLQEPHGSLRPELVEVTAQGVVYLHGIGQRHLYGLRGADEELALPEHMSPEQILGDEPDPQSDVFLFGMLLYQMLEGGLPFTAGDGGIGYQIRQGASRELGPEVPRQLRRIVARCLQKRALDRYPDMASVSSALVRFLRHHTSRPRDVLASQALDRAGLADALPTPLEPGPERGTTPLFPTSRLPWIAAGVGLLLVGGLVVRSLSTDTPSAAGDPRGIVKRPARIQVLARPWAEVHIDGVRADVTPVGRPLEVSPGRHVVTFRHPQAPDESRTIEISAGQTIVLDVDMKIAPGAIPDAGAADGGETDDSP
ncbi:MAG: serine/threonine-protein kinase [Polyangiaceae bacterium]